MEPCIPVLESDCVSTGGGFCVMFLRLVSLGKACGKPIGAEQEPPAHLPARQPTCPPASRPPAPLHPSLLQDGLRPWTACCLACSHTWSFKSSLNGIQKVGAAWCSDQGPLSFRSRKKIPALRRCPCDGIFQHLPNLPIQNLCHIPGQAPNV